MDFIGITLLLTLVVLLGVGALAMGFHRPPTFDFEIKCPADQNHATVALSWSAQLRRPTVVDCDHRRWREGECSKTCDCALQNPSV